MRRFFRRVGRGDRDGDGGGDGEGSRPRTSNLPTRVNITNLRLPQPPLHDAASKGQTDTVAQLLNQGAAVDQPNHEGATALHLAIKECHPPTTHLLLTRGANIEPPYGPTSSKPIHLAAFSLNPSLMRILLQHKPNLQSRTNGLTALFLAISAGDETVVRVLLEAGADARARTTSEEGTGESVLHMAVGSFKNALLPLLIRYGADVNVAGTNPEGQTALHIAAQYGNVEAVEELVKAGADIYARFPSGESALEVAAQYGQIGVVEILIQHGMDPLRQIGGGGSAVDLSVIHGKTEMVRWFLDRYAERIDRMSKINMVIGAAGANRITILEMLDKAGFPMLALDRNGVSALFIAVNFKHSDAIVYMLRRGEDPEPHIPTDPNSWVAKDESFKPAIDLLRSAKRQREAQPHAKLFPEWRYRDEEEGSVAFQANLIAKAVSVNATRKVEANQEPAGIFSCTLCHDLDFRRGMARDAEVVYYMREEDMRAAAERCRGCRFLRDCLDEVRKAYGVKVWAMLRDDFLVLRSEVQGGPLLVHFHSGNPFQFRMRQIEIYVNEGNYAPKRQKKVYGVYANILILGSGTTWPVVGTGRDVSLEGWGHECALVAKRFLHECTRNHTQCQFTLGTLPTRVIRVPAAGEPCLYVSKGEKSKYMTLSHSWGGITPLTTTTATLSQRLQEIPYTTLPKTFQDAITITRSLGIEYLWIDSLCIVQDDRDDWARESARMKNVYTNCYAMISANSSANPNGGCFSPPGVRSQSRSFAVPTVGPYFSKVTAFVRLTSLRDTFHAEIVHTIGDNTVGALALVDKSQPRTILNRRGWCFQERVLAPRILHLGLSELAWECPSTVTCECQTITTLHDRESRFKALFADHILRSAQAGRSPQSANRNQADVLLWMHFVEEFTQRQLTYSTDMLHALSGLAEFMNAATGQNEYLCGLWRSNLAEFLLWHVDVPDSHFIANMPLMAPRPFRLTRVGHQMSREARRHAPYYAPSWSWASVIGPVTFQIGRLDRGDGDQVSHVRKDGLLESVVARKSMLGHVDAHCVVDSLNRYGPPKEPASLTIRGETILATWVGKRDVDGDSVDYREGEHILSYGATGSTTSASGGALKADFMLDPLGEEALGIEVGDDLLLLATILDNEAVRRHESGGAVYGVKRATVVGLVLALSTVLPSSSQGGDQAAEQLVYKRVGLFFTDADDWSRSQSTRTVVIV
ncbi:hypothetical protein V497_02707 [Pseudogymnoascus sp. VKM F-4516 (FW-969)]|nr:hypothetical protein V497_02707 [Pseudogymnoascus sp. VKM F-4516 (FW-969)]